MPAFEMRLPFLYESGLYPSLRHRLARNFKLRADAIVDVPLLDLSDLDVVIQLSYAGKAEEILDALVTSIEEQGFWAFGDGRARLEL